MAAKLVQTLADDNPDLQKQIGCMTGIFQLFDRQQLVAGRHYGHRRLLLPANPQFSNGSLDREYNGTYLRRHAEESNYFAGPNERQRFSNESSRASISSSCSSSLSSWECGRSAQPESSPFDRAVFSEAPSFDPIPKQSGSFSPNVRHKSMDLRDVVKDSMYREVGGGGLQVKHKDSRKADYRDGLAYFDNVPADIKESSTALAKLREPQWYCHDARQLPRSSSTRDRSSQALTKDAPRFSYDGREQMQNRLSFESRETIKSSVKLKELPRLSFDSREGSFPSLHSAVSSNMVQKSTERPGGVSNERSVPSVVAKLMGLDALPNTSSANGNASLGSKSPDMAESFSPYPKASKRNEMSSHMRGPGTLGSSVKEPESPRWRNPDGTIRPMPRVPNEPAPWKQTDGNRILQKSGQKSVTVLQKTSDAVPSVYGEIEKRLKDLEFKQSGKDLRALKQILEAIQAKGLLETREEDLAINFEIDRNSIPKSRQVSRSEMRPVMQGNYSIASTSRGSDVARVFESPIVIIKPSKLVEKDGFVDYSMLPIEDLSNLRRLQADVPVDTRKNTARRIAGDQARKLTRKDSMATSDRKVNSKNVKPNQTPSRSQPNPKENSSLPKNSSAVSPRLQQKKLELERRARPPTPPSDAKKSKRVSNQKMNETASPGVRNRVKYSYTNPSEDQMSEVSNDTRTPSYQGDDSSVRSDESNFLRSKLDIEVSSQSPSAGSVQFSESKLMPVDVYSPLVDDDEAFPEFSTAAAEHHSPVSVLDPSAHIEDDPAPIKTMQTSFRGNSAQVSSHDRCEDTVDVTMMDSVDAPSALEIDRKKLQNIDRLVQKLRRVNSTHDEESTDYIASLCENSSPDHRYISEILLASGLLLRDLGSGPATFQLHSSGQAINPELFFVLEQTKSSGTSKGAQTRIHRKLIFDAVNEILTGKLTVTGIPGEPWLTSVGNLARKALKAQRLLKELCTEVELLEAWNTNSSSLEDGLKGILWEDVVSGTGRWTELREEKSTVVLGIERLIFKDLVNEILVGCGTKPSRRRELFAAS